MMIVNLAFSMLIFSMLIFLIADFIAAIFSIVVVIKAYYENGLEDEYDE